MISGTANFSPCGLYRYELTRSWDATKPKLIVVMLNPSTADAAVDDPTIRRVRGFAEAAGYGEALILNLFALRSTDPAQLQVHEDPVGPANNTHLVAALYKSKARKQPVLAAWGNHGRIGARAFRVMQLVEGVQWVCLGRTLSGSPRHPLYVPSTQRLVPFAFLQPGSGGAS